MILHQVHELGYDDQLLQMYSGFEVKLTGIFSFLLQPRRLNQKTIFFPIVNWSIPSNNINTCHRHEIEGRMIY